MHVDRAIRTIAEFWEGRPLRWAGSGPSHVERLEKQFGSPFPDELRTYIRDFVPKRRITFEGIGNPVYVYGLWGDLRLRAKQPGYSWSDLTGEPLDAWDRSWFLFAGEGADPIIVDLSRGDTEIKKAWHGEGNWSFFPIADTIGQFLLWTAAAIHIHRKIEGLCAPCERGLATPQSVRDVRAELKGFAKSRFISPGDRDLLEQELEELSDDLRYARSPDGRFRLFVEDWARNLYRTVRTQPRFNDAHVGARRDCKAMVVGGSVPSERALRDLRAIIDAYPPGVEVVWKVDVRSRK